MPRARKKTNGNGNGNGKEPIQPMYKKMMMTKHYPTSYQKEH